MEFRRPYPNSGVEIPENGFDYIIYGEDTNGDGINDVVYAKNGRTGEIEFEEDSISKMFNDRLPTDYKNILITGEFYLDNTIKFSVGAYIEFRNSKLYLMDNANKTILQLSDGNTLVFHNSLIDGNKTNQSSTAHGILVPTGATNVTIINPIIRNVNGYGLYLYECTAKVYGLISYQNNGYGVAIEAYTSDVVSYIHSSEVYNNGQDGIHVEAITSGKAYVDISHSKTYNNYVGISALMSAGGRLTIESSYVYENKSDGIALSACSYFKIIGSHIYNNGTDSNASGYRNGVRIDDSGVSPATTHGVLIANEIFGNAENGVVERGEADWNIIDDTNIIYSNSAGNIVVSGEHTYYPGRVLSSLPSDGYSTPIAVYYDGTNYYLAIWDGSTWHKVQLT